MSIVSGTRLGPYEIVESIGAGGMGEVWRAKDTRLDREVAIKVLPAGFAENEQFLQRFDREAKAISSLNHPHICTLHDVGHDNGSHYIVMELIEGESLADRLRKGPLSLPEVLMYGRQTAAALDAAHRKGVVHRDLKPGNIMLTRSGAKLLDFGLAKTATEGQAPIDGLTSMATAAKPLTQEGTILGTFQYMAPEQLDGFEADARTDIFALGTVLYEMATGRRAFSGQTKSSLIASIVSSQPEPISQVAPMSPPALDHVVRRCLEKDPDDRWQSAQDIASELQWISEAGSQAGVAAPVTMRRKTREKLAWSLAGLLFALVLILAFLQLRPVEAPGVVMSHILPPGGGGFDLSGIYVTGFAVSPDGKKIAYVAPDANGDVHLYVRFLDIMEPRLLGGTRGAENPFWSPDSRFLAFFADGKLKKVDISGAPPLTVTTANNGRPGAWNEDGVILFSPTTTDPIYRIPDTGGDPVQVTTLDREKGETTHRWAHFLPDGDHFLYLASSHNVGSGGDEVSAVWIGSLEAPSERKLLFRGRSNAFYADGLVVYARDDILVAQVFEPGSLELVGDAIPIAEGVAYAPDFFGGAFSVSPAGVLVYGVGSTNTDSQLTWLDRSGNEIATVGTPADSSGPHLSPEGRRAIMEIEDEANGTSDLWMIDLERDLRTRFTFENGRESNPRWSPDGSQIAYWSQAVGSNGGAVKVKSASGSSDPQVVYESEGASLRPADWHPDGTMFLATTGPAGPDMLRMNLDGGEPEELFAREFSEVHSYLSPDRNWLVYVTNESGDFENYVTSYPDLRGKWQLSRDGSRCCGATWRRNEAFYKGPNGQFIAVRIEPVDGSLNVAMPEVLFVNPRLDSFDVSHDGQRILATIAPEIDERPLTMISNWTAMIESRK